MKIAFNFILQHGPYGGGNSVIQSLAELLPQAGHEVAWSLDDDDIDIIILTDPRTRSPNISFGAGAILRYLAFNNPRALVLQQIHDCDERKNTKHMNRRQRIANYAADHTVCVGSWMLDLDVVRPEHRNAYSAVLNGARTATFHDRGYTPWDGQEPLRLITHHWGANWMKGFDVYGLLDDMTTQSQWRDVMSFTYVGNVPSDFKFRNARQILPMAGDALADELRRHHVYITASINEPAGLHHIEGALCGLPIIYRNSGGLPEYCKGYGVEFETAEDVPEAINRMRYTYDSWRDVLNTYEHTESRMVNDYLALFDKLMSKREETVARRQIWRNPLLFALNQIPF